MKQQRSLRRRTDISGPGRIGEDGDRAGLQRRLGELGTVRRRARQGGEQVAGFGVLSPQRDPADPDLRDRGAGGRARPDGIGQLAQGQPGIAAGAQGTGQSRHLPSTSRPSDRLVTLPG